MPHNQLKALLQDIDIYLLDQILKGRFSLEDKILDAGCGEGRNLAWMATNGYDVTALDKDPGMLTILKDRALLPHSKTICASLDEMPFNDQVFNKIICSAVLHFATNHEHFHGMFSELVRVLKKRE